MTTAIDINTNENISIKPIAIYQSDAFDVLLLADVSVYRSYDVGIVPTPVNTILELSAVVFGLLFD